MARLTDRYGNPITDNQQVILWTGTYDNTQQNITLSDNIYNYSRLLFIRLPDSTDGTTCQVDVLEGETMLHGSTVAGNCRLMRMVITNMSKSNNVINIAGSNYYSVNEKQENLKFEKVIGIKKL
jgi:hypothetical protein